MCPDCGSPMEHLGYKFAREELRITPAKVVRVHYMQETLMCPVCRQEDETTIVEAKTPTPLLAHSPASPDMVAMVMYQKSFLHLPLYRQSKD
ncbi:IS66 family transposase zinc-finger binding domain-containing protein [Blautia wexlerae]|nr:IS66 family transposase zinc-finger binding domain-containing protein [Blautia wexlerae]MDB6455678.1 IS66 family transposase zinc-finger binding domain-containing protein [Blautia wexlerae]